MIGRIVHREESFVAPDGREVTYVAQYVQTGDGMLQRLKLKDAFLPEGCEVEVEPMLGGKFTIKSIVL